VSGRAQTTAAKQEKAFLVGTERPKTFMPSMFSTATVVPAGYKGCAA